MKISENRTSFVVLEHIIVPIIISAPVALLVSQVKGLSYN